MRLTKYEQEGRGRIPAKAAGRSEQRGALCRRRAEDMASLSPGADGAERPADQGWADVQEEGQRSLVVPTH